VLARGTGSTGARRRTHHAEAVEVRLLVALAAQQHLGRAPGERACGARSSLSTRSPGRRPRLGATAAQRALPRLGERWLQPQTTPALPPGTAHARPAPTSPQPVPRAVWARRARQGAPKVPCSEVSTPVVSIRAMPTSCARPARSASAKPSQVSLSQTPPGQPQPNPGRSASAKPRQVSLSQTPPGQPQPKPARCASAKPARFCHFDHASADDARSVTGSTALSAQPCAQGTWLHRTRLDWRCASGSHAAPCRGRAPRCTRRRRAPAGCWRSSGPGARSARRALWCHCLSLEPWQNARNAPEVPAAHAPQTQHAHQAALWPASAGMNFS